MNKHILFAIFQEPIINLKNKMENKMKTLIIKYLPSGENSNTKKLLDRFMEKNIDNKDLEEIDLLASKTPIFNQESITAYYLRNYLGKALNEEQAAAILPFDKIIQKVQSADFLVFAFPMHNFSLPGIVKSFIDSFMFNGEFFNISDSHKKDMIQGKKILVLYSHGGSYPEGSEYEKYDFVKSLLNQEFSFMGIKDVAFISYSTADPAKKEDNLQLALDKLDKMLS